MTCLSFDTHHINYEHLQSAGATWCIFFGALHLPVKWLCCELEHSDTYHQAEKRTGISKQMHIRNSVISILCPTVIRTRDRRGEKTLITFNFLKNPASFQSSTVGLHSDRNSAIVVISKISNFQISKFPNFLVFFFFFFFVAPK